MIAHAAQEAERPLESTFIEVVEKQAANASGFVPMRQEEIAVAPLLVLSVSVRAERPAGVASRAMPVQHVLVVGIVRREIEAAAEPPDRGPGARRGHQEADIAVRGRRMRISRMKYQRQAHGLEGWGGNP